MQKKPLSIPSILHDNVSEEEGKRKKLKGCE
jgi:hypothetical protein